MGEGGRMYLGLERHRKTMDDTSTNWADKKNIPWCIHSLKVDSSLIDGEISRLFYEFRRFVTVFT